MFWDFLRPYMDERDNKRDIKKLEKVVVKINQFEELLKQLSDEELKQKTEAFKERIAKGESLDSILPEAYAVVRESSERVLGMRHFDVQLMGGVVLHQGRIAEMKTGEGKTLVATLPVYLNALTGKGVHVITANEYLAKRDSEIMGELYNFLGLSVGMIYANMPPEERREAYQKDITYGTNNEFGFDYLRDNLVKDTRWIMQRELNFALIDEVDSLLVDEARTPLIIASYVDQEEKAYMLVAQLIPKLNADEDYEVDLKEKRATLTEKGVQKMEQMLGIENLADEKNMALAHHVNNGLKAYTIMHKDVDYIVENGEIVIVDEFTGRLMYGRRYDEGLHQAIEAKEGMDVRQETQVRATITFQNFFRMYRKLSGMTGTAKTEEDEFRSIYGMDVVPIPTNKPVQRVDLPDLVFRTQEGKFHAIVEKIRELHKEGQPVLVGTVSIEISELLSRKLKEQNIPHQVLNAKVHDLEAEIISHAGEKGSVTIATNMAGRGTDIKLGQGVHGLGGLYVIGTDRHESRRIDNQLRGRSGRQGDPGTTRFYLSMEDDLIKRFCSDDLVQVMDKIGMDDSMPIENKTVSKLIESAQKRVETNNFDIRKMILDYDDVMNLQRQVIYDERNKILRGENITENILSMADMLTEAIIAEISMDEKYPEQWDLEKLDNRLRGTFSLAIPLDKKELAKQSAEEAEEMIKNLVKTAYQENKQKLGEAQVLRMEQNMLLEHLDKEWKEHLTSMEQLKRGVRLRVYAQKNPVQEFRFEAFEMFNALKYRIQKNTVEELFHTVKVMAEGKGKPKTIQAKPMRIEISL